MVKKFLKGFVAVHFPADIEIGRLGSRWPSLRRQLRFSSCLTEERKRGLGGAIGNRKRLNSQLLLDL
jgi:hypothetical protein